MREQLATVAMSNKQFLQGAANWGSHRPLLLLSLHLTKGAVIELGSGDFSTPYLSNYCNKHKRVFATYDNDAKWAMATGSKYIRNWEVNTIWLQPCGVAFIDHAPGEHRRRAIELFKSLAEIIVVHDSELHGAGDYKLEPVLTTFKYRLNYNLTGGGAGASAVSNKVDLNIYRGLTLGDYVFDAV